MRVSGERGRWGEESVRVLFFLYVVRMVGDSIEDIQTICIDSYVLTPLPRSSLLTISLILSSLCVYMAPSPKESPFFVVFESLAHTNLSIPHGITPHALKYRTNKSRTQSAGTKPSGQTNRNKQQ